ncbi:lytic murein transglycosylase B [Neptunicella sp. SCSIO 80796]|uniref:lytic murein transglycosylase B n=1 Tax=Neptunicella plasticusilytica TaxID=3117012 RepID=UPI003A4DEF91
MRLLIKIGCFSQLLLACSVLANSPLPAAQQTFVDRMVSKHQFDAAQLTELLQTTHKQQTIIDAIQRPWEAKPWYQYYPIFLTEKRRNDGVEFWLKHAEALQKAEQQSGVPAEIIVAILGVESNFGTHQGNHSVLDSLYTLGFHYPARAKFFTSELEQFLLLCREEKFDPRLIQGSYAGAMGWGQFIASSYRHYAVDFDQDSIRDLLNNPEDAIGSVANYFQKNGWKKGQPVAFKAKLTNSDVESLLSKNLKPEHQWQQVQRRGISIDGSLDNHTPVKLLQFDLSQGHEYWVGLNNFYTITRYNHSPLYAMAVYQLSQQIKQQRQQQI